jgi:uncharacterized protein YcbX
MTSVTHLFRYPIKAHGREALEKVSLITGQSMPWDRHWAVAHEATKFDPNAPEWVMCRNFTIASKAPGLMALTARLDEENGIVHLTHPDLGTLSINPDDADDAQELVKWTASLVPANRMKSSFIAKLPKRGMTDTDFPSISINTHSSLADLSTKANVDLSIDRWRGNIWVDGTKAWEEFDWIGRKLRIGTVELLVRAPIERCRATTSNPLTGIIDVDTLSVLNSDYGHQDFGVYAEVIVDGHIECGDTLELI